MDLVFDFFTLVLMDPMINFLVILDQLLFNSFGLAIIAFTIIIRAVMFPLTLRQLHQTRAMQALQPRIQELQKKFSDPKRRQEELMKAYREAGVNPLGCLGPMLLQLPVMIALFYAVRQSLALAPESLDKLNGHLYSWSYIQNGVPLEESFLGMDLREDNFLMVGLVGITTWAQSKTTVTPTTDDKARAQQQLMMYMMPLMFMFFALSFPSGVSIYWVVTSVVSIGFNVVTYGLPMLKIEPLIKPPGPAPAEPPQISPPSGKAPDRARSGNETRTTSGKSRSKRKNRRRRP